MKTINTYIIEKLKVSKNKYGLFPKNKNELVKMIKAEIKQNGNDCDLNHIDVSKITDMSFLFSRDPKDGYGLYEFNGDISEWNVSNVKNMTCIFRESVFNGDISEWDVSNVENMSHMFCSSLFNNDISKWNLSSIDNMCGMFWKSKFNQDISNWKINPECYLTYWMFDDCPIKDEYKPKKLQD